MTSSSKRMSRQKSVSIIYDQVRATSTNSRQIASLIDPTIEKAAGLSHAEWAELWAGKLETLAQKNPFDGNWYFPDLPPHLNRRLFYNPNARAEEQLRFRGQYVEQLTGGGYLLLNRLGDRCAEHQLGSFGSWTETARCL